MIDQEIKRADLVSWAAGETAKAVTLTAMDRAYLGALAALMSANPWLSNEPDEAVTVLELDNALLGLNSFVDIDALNAQIVTLTAEIDALNAPKSITIYNYNAINRYGSVCFWVNHSGSIEILRIGDTAAIATGLRLCGDRLEANGNVILTGLSGWHYWQFRKSGGSLTAWINGVMAAGSTIAPAAMTAVLQLGGISTMTTSFDTSVIDPPPTRE